MKLIYVLIKVTAITQATAIQTFATERGRLAHLYASQHFQKGNNPPHKKGFRP